MPRKIDGKTMSWTEERIWRKTFKASGSAAVATATIKKRRKRSRRKRRAGIKKG